MVDKIPKNLILWHVNIMRHSEFSLHAGSSVGTQANLDVWALFVAAFKLQQQCWLVVTEIVWPEKPKIIHPVALRKEVCGPLICNCTLRSTFDFDLVYDAGKIIFFFMYYVGQKVCSSYGKTGMNFLANPVFSFLRSVAVSMYSVVM